MSVLKSRGGNSRGNLSGRGVGGGVEGSWRRVVNKGSLLAWASAVFVCATIVCALFPPCPVFRVHARHLHLLLFLVRYVQKCKPRVGGGVKESGSSSRDQSVELLGVIGDLPRVSQCLLMLFPRFCVGDVSCLESSVLFPKFVRKEKRIKKYAVLCALCSEPPTGCALSASQTVPLAIGICVGGGGRKLRTGLAAHPSSSQWCS